MILLMDLTIKFRIVKKNWVRKTSKWIWYGTLFGFPICISEESGCSAPTKTRSWNCALEAISTGAWRWQPEEEVTFGCSCVRRLVVSVWPPDWACMAAQPINVQTAGTNSCKNVLGENLRTEQTKSAKVFACFIGRALDLFIYTY